MSPRKLQNEIKQDFRADNSVWSTYRTTIVNNFAATDYQDLSDHLLREFNRKIVDLGMNEELLFTPFDAGFRFLGVSIDGGIGANSDLLFNGEPMLYNGENLIYN